MSHSKKSEDNNHDGSHRSHQAHDLEERAGHHHTADYR